MALAGIAFLMGIFAASSKAERFGADAPEISYYGRWDEGEGFMRSGRGATYIRAGFTGSFLKADMEGDGIRWHVIIDGGEPRKFYPQGENTVLAENLDPGPHQAYLVRETEAREGISVFRGFEVDDGERLLFGAEPKARRLEFVGDSITAGAVNEGRYRGGSWFETENGDMAYGPQLARMLDADYSVVAKSGEGVCHNYDGGWPDDGVHTGDSYRWTFYYDKKSPENLLWDAEKFPVDGVIVMIGTNDLSDPRKQPGEEFEAGYEKLLDAIREMNPEAEIICLEPLPRRFGEIARPRIEAVVGRRVDEGDEKLHFITLGEGESLLSEADYTDGTHPTVKGAEKIALYLKDKVRAIMGWDEPEEERDAA